jgi:hypothetical protein
MAYDEDPEEYEVVDEEILGGELSNNQGEVLTRNVRVISQGGGLLRRRNVRLRFLASCGHLIHSLDELGGRCGYKNCNALVCRDCLRICERCFKPLCPMHTKLHNGKVYCPTCKWIVIFFGSFGDRERNPSQVPQLQPRIERRGIFRNLFPDSSWIERWNETIGRVANGGFWREKNERRS